MIGSDVDLLQQALTNSGLTNGNVVTSASSVQSSSQLESASATDAVSRDAAAAGVTAPVSSVDEPSSSLPDSVSQPTQLSYVSTMAVHDSITGMIRRHPVRKVLSMFTVCISTLCSRISDPPCFKRT